MSFLSSLFLWALPLAAVPVVIHLLHRRRRQVVQWGAMQLLLESVPTKRRIWHVNDFLLMLVRTLAVVAIVPGLCASPRSVPACCRARDRAATSFS